MQEIGIIERSEPSRGGCVVGDGMSGKSMSGKRRILLTGAAGRIASNVYAHARDHYWFRLADRSRDNLARLTGENHEVVALDIADLDACQAACAGIDTVVHLAADPSPQADFYGSLPCCLITKSAFRWVVAS